VLRVSVFNGDENTLKDPILGRPFSNNLERVQYDEDHNTADWILGNLDYLQCNEDYKKIKGSKEFMEMPEKFVFWTMHDNPQFAYEDTKSLKFVCQPLRDTKENRSHNVVPVPLQMRHYEKELISDLDFIEDCRKAEKEYDFVYVGQIVYAHRGYLKNLPLESYDLEITKPIWDVKNTSTRVEMMKDFCRRLARAEYAFAPRGVGTSSFRLYQAMMSGTVPIVSGMKDYPFSEEVDWNEMCVINEEDSQYDFDSLIDSESYDGMRQKAIQFWEDYVRIENCDKRLFDKYLERE
jgi:hypothetical protein